MVLSLVAGPRGSGTLTVLVSVTGERSCTARHRARCICCALICTLIRTGIYGESIGRTKVATSRIAHTATKQ